METPQKDADDSFLPVISPVDFAFPLRTPASAASLLPKLAKKSSKSTLLSDPRKEKDDRPSVVLAGPDTRPPE